MHCVQAEYGYGSNTPLRTFQIYVTRHGNHGTNGSDKVADSRLFSRDMWPTNHLMFLLKHDFVSTAPRPGSGLTLSSHTEFGGAVDRGTGEFTGKKAGLKVYEVNINQTFDFRNE